jgi:hypothetical protein
VSDAEKVVPQTVVRTQPVKQVQQTLYNERGNVTETVVRQSGVTSSGERWGSVEITERRPVSSSRRAPAT